jgi:hypothetical protein
VSINPPLSRQGGVPYAPDPDEEKKKKNPTEKTSFSQKL